MQNSQKKLAVIFGNPVAQSKSPEMQMQFAKNVGVELNYLKVLTTLPQFETSLKEWIEKGIVGANITVPFKEVVMPYCDQLTIEAEEAKAVNTIRIEKDGSITGHNSDGIGLLRDITEIKRIDITGKRILVLGAGGAVRGILGPLLSHKPASLIITNRTFSKAKMLAEEFSHLGEIKAVERDDLTGSFDLIINGTSASLQNEFPPLPAGVISSHTIGYDLVYGDQPTIFMEYLLSEGGRAAYDGLGMLIEQGVYAFEFWFGKRPSIEGVLEIFGRTS